jgi:fibro-slime domain-containing protein
MKRDRRLPGILTGGTWALALLASACASDTDSTANRSSGSGGSATMTDAAAGGSGGSTNAGTGGASINVPVGDPDAGADDPPIMIDPSEFVTTEIGGYKLGPSLTGDGSAGGPGIGDFGDNAGGCGRILVGVVRDFRPNGETDGHPDFQIFSGVGATTGLVAATLGTDQKPVYASQCETDETTEACPFGQQTTSQASFDQWYRDAEATNLPYLVYFLFAPNGNVFTFQSEDFYPLDEAPWGDLYPDDDDGTLHNFHFTTEIHTRFKYNGGEQFEFTGDDDVWVFIDGKLVIDLGGLHSRLNATVTLDERASELGLEVGKVYSLDLFHAERRNGGSHFRIDTNLSFVNCGTVVR